jgi:hypothetical protein
VKYWEIIADNLHKAGWSLGWVSALDVQGRTIWIVDAHGYGKRFIVHADEILTAFLELQRAIHDFAVTVSQEIVFNDCKTGFANGKMHRIIEYDALHRAKLPNHQRALRAALNDNDHECQSGCRSRS